MTDTIFALTSGSRRAGVAVIRVSGPQATTTFTLLAKKDLPPPRVATFATFYDLDRGHMLDRGLALYFKGPASFTGEDTVEYHVHGGAAVIDGFLAALGHIQGCRMAEPGEFTRRAFENEKLDLTAAEAIADLIDAETEAQRVQALDQLGGSLAALYQGWAARLTKILAHQEAEIEFPDEDMPTGVAAGLVPQIMQLADDIAVHLDDKRRGERLRNGVSVAILGAPNAGKSSLLNALAGRDAAIVSDEAGTTRDVIETHLDLGGYPVILADTAGLREAEGKVEAEGIARARKRAQDADIRIILFDGTQNTPDTETQTLVDDDAIIALTKADLFDAPPAWGKAYMTLSANTGKGLDKFLTVLTKKVAASFETTTNMPSLTRARHRAALQDTRDALSRALGAPLPELAAEDLRMALRHLGAITGRVHVEDLLDRIFRDFCIGK